MSRREEEEQNIITALRWAQEYIVEYQKTGNFSPFALLTGESDKEQRHFCNCVDFIETLTRAAEDFRKIRDNISRA